MISKQQGKMLPKKTQKYTPKENIPKKLPDSMIKGPSKKVTDSKEVSKQSASTQNTDRLSFNYGLTLCLESKSQQQNQGIFGYKRSVASTATGTTLLQESRNLTSQIASTPMSKVKKMNFIYGSGDQGVFNELSGNKLQNSFSGIKHIDKNQSSVKTGFTVPAEVAKPSKKLFTHRHFSHQYESDEVEHIRRFMGTPLGSTVPPSPRAELRSREMTPSRNPIIEGDMTSSFSSKKHVEHRKNDSEQYNNKFTTELHYFTPRKDLSQTKTDHLHKKFQSTVLNSRENSVVDQILNDTKPWKNDSKELFVNIKRKIQAKWNETKIQGIIKEVDDHRKGGQDHSSFKITNPKFGHASFKQANLHSKNESFQSYSNIKAQQWNSKIFM